MVTFETILQLSSTFLLCLMGREFRFSGVVFVILEQNTQIISSDEYVALTLHCLITTVNVYNVLKVTYLGVFLSCDRRRFILSLSESVCRCYESVSVDGQ